MSKATVPPERVGPAVDCPCHGVLDTDAIRVGQCHHLADRYVLEVTFRDTGNGVILYAGPAGPTKDSGVLEWVGVPLKDRKALVRPTWERLTARMRADAREGM